MRTSMTWGGKHYVADWLTGVIPPEDEPVTQVGGICYTVDERIVLISSDGRDWNIPGGRPEKDESREATLRREVWEEACCLVLRCGYLGTQRIADMNGGSIHHQLRSWVEVTAEPFAPCHEISHRCLVEPARFLSQLSWGCSPVAAELLRLADRRHDQRVRPDPSDQR